MDNRHVNIPKDQISKLPSCFRETKLGWPKKSIRQYRCGRLHIREYEDKFEAHIDNVDPQKNPLGHIIKDAPEVLAAISAGSIAAATTANLTYKKTGSKLTAAFAGFTIGLITAYAANKGYDKLKET